MSSIFSFDDLKDCPFQEVVKEKKTTTISCKLSKSLCKNNDGIFADCIMDREKVMPVAYTPKGFITKPFSFGGTVDAQA